MIHISAKRAVKEITKAVEQIGYDTRDAAGDRDYDNYYRGTLVPDIVGTVLTNVGASPKLLMHLDELNVAAGQKNFTTVCRQYDVIVTPDARAVFGAAQLSQDLGKWYGYALAAAQAALPKEEL